MGIGVFGGSIKSVEEVVNYLKNEGVREVNVHPKKDRVCFTFTIKKTKYDENNGFRDVSGNVVLCVNNFKAITGAMIDTALYLVASAIMLGYPVNYGINIEAKGDMEDKSIRAQVVMYSPDKKPIVLLEEIMEMPPVSKKFNYEIIVKRDKTSKIAVDILRAITNPLNRGTLIFDKQTSLLYPATVGIYYGEQFGLDSDTTGFLVQNSIIQFQRCVFRVMYKLKTEITHPSKNWSTFKGTITPTTNKWNQPEFKCSTRVW